MASFDLFSLNRITFGLLCLGAAALLLSLVGLVRLKRWRTHRKKPDLRQRGAGSSYSGGRRRSGGKALPYSGLDSYKGSRRRKPGQVRPVFQPPSYKGRR